MDETACLVPSTALTHPGQYLGRSAVTRAELRWRGGSVLPSGRCSGLHSGPALPLLLRVSPRGSERGLCRICSGQGRRRRLTPWLLVSLGDAARVAKGPRCCQGGDATTEPPWGSQPLQSFVRPARVAGLSTRGLVTWLGPVAVCAGRRSACSYSTGLPLCSRPSRATRYPQGVPAWLGRAVQRIPR